MELAVHLKDRRMAALSFVPWMLGGGLFVPSSESVPLGTAVRLTVRFGAQEERHDVSGRVAARIFDLDSAHVPGLYVQFDPGEPAARLKEVLERSAQGLGEPPGMFVRRMQAL